MNTFVGVWILLAAAVAQMSDAATVKVTVFYESLCPDSIRFIKKQLYPTYVDLNGHMEIEFVPFGKAYIMMKPWRIICQHGQNECVGNAVQACALAKYPDPKSRMEIIHCYMTDFDPPSATQRCAKKINFDAKEIEQCSTNEEGRQLLTANQEKTQRFMERLSFVPTVLFNDEYTSDDQKDALNNLKSVICRKLEPKPEQCRGN